MNLKIDILFAFIGVTILLFIYLFYAVRAVKKVAESQNAEIKADEKTITNTDAKVSDTIQQVNQLKNTAFIAGHGVRQVSTLLVNTEKLKSLSGTGIDCDDDFNVLGNLTAYNFYGIDQTVNNWNATTNTPTLINNDVTHAGYVYYVNVAGTQFGITFAVGDYLIYDGSGVISKRTVSLGYTPENVANKAVNFSVINDTLYPSVNAVQNQLLSLINGLNWKHSVLYATTTSENLSLTGLTATIDGSVRTLLITDRILVKNQTDGKQNGIYNPNSSTWTRTLDANTNDLLTAATVYVISGTAEINRVYSVNSVVNIGVSNVTFALIAGVGTYTNGTYLSLTGNIFDVNVTQLRVNLDTVYSLFSDTRIFRGDDTGAADAITVTVTPTYNAYTDKDVFYVKVLHANATTTPTINISGKGAVTIVKKSGNALLVGDIQIGYYFFMYDSNTSQVHLMSPSLESTTNLPDTTDKRYCTDAQKVVIGNTSNTNTGDQTLASLGAQAQLNGTGLVRMAGTAVSYDSSTYLTSATVGTYGWLLNGNTLGAKATLGSIDNQDVGIITNNTERITVLNGGNVGIGTTGPVSPFDLRGTAITTFPNNPIVNTTSSTNAFAANMGGGIQFGGKYDSGNVNVTTFGYIGGLKENATDGNYAGRLVFGTRTAGAGGADMTRMVIDSTGNVGIGLTAPTGKLHIVDTTLAGSGALAGSLLNLAQTWNTTGTPTAILLTVTNTASNAASLLMDLKVATVSQFSISLAGNVSPAGYMKESTDTLSGAGAVSVTKTTTKYTTAGVGDALTLANGVDGQIKRIILDVLTSAGHTAILTPATKKGFTTVTFSAAGQSVSLQFVTTRGWIVIGSFGAVIS